MVLDATETRPRHLPPLVPQAGVVLVEEIAHVIVLAPGLLHREAEHELPLAHIAHGGVTYQVPSTAILRPSRWPEGTHIRGPDEARSLLVCGDPYLPPRVSIEYAAVFITNGLVKAHEGGGGAAGGVEVLACFVAVGVGAGDMGGGQLGVEVGAGPREGVGIAA